MEWKNILELWDRFETSTVSELELDFQGTHLRLTKKEAASALASVTPPSSVPPILTDPLSEETHTESSGSSNEKSVKAPLVGVFYRSSAPGEEPFTAPGKTFFKGDVIGIIEAMKCMNEIVAPEDGCVCEILAEDAQLVEFNQTLFTYLPAGETYV